MNRADIDLFDLFSVDEQGYPLAPNLYQIQDKFLRELYERDKGSQGDLDGTLKLRYMKEAGVVYFLADPKSPPSQIGCSQAEAIQLAIANYDLPKDWQPDNLILLLVKKYREAKMGVALSAVEASHRALHNASLVCNLMGEVLSSKIVGGVSAEDIDSIVNTVKKIGEISASIPNLIKANKEAKQNLENETQQQVARGGKVITSSMSTRDNEDLEAQVEAEKRRLGISDNKPVARNMSYESTK